MRQRDANPRQIAAQKGICPEFTFILGVFERMELGIRLHCMRVSALSIGIFGLPRIVGVVLPLVIRPVSQGEAIGVICCLLQVPDQSITRARWEKNHVARQLASNERPSPL